MHMRVRRPVLTCMLISETEGLWWKPTSHWSAPNIRGSQFWVLFGDFWATRRYKYLNIDSKF